MARCYGSGKLTHSPPRPELSNPTPPLPPNFKRGSIWQATAPRRKLASRKLISPLPDPGRPDPRAPASGPATFQDRFTLDSDIYHFHFKLLF